jgi:sulfonate transport system permease protein
VNPPNGPTTHADAGRGTRLDAAAAAETGTCGEPAALTTVRRVPGSAERDPRGSARRWRMLEIGLAAGVPILLLALWQLASTVEWIDPKLYPSPTTLVNKARDLFGSGPGGHLGDDLWRSVQRILWGYLWGVLFGLAFGVVMGMSRVVRAALDTTLTALYTVPKLALIGVFMLILGYDEKPVIVVIALTVFFFVWIQTMAAIMSVAPFYREAALSFGSSRWQLFRHVLLPAALPQIFVGLRVAAGVTVLTVIGVEFVFAPESLGLGYRINNARQILDPAQMYVAIILASVLGVVFTWIVRLVGRRLSPWTREDEGAPAA